MKIIGIDPGLRITGFGVIETHKCLTHLASGVIKTSGVDLSKRLRTIFNGIAALIDEHGPANAAIEKVFVNINPQSTLLLGQARGAAICGLASADVPVFEYTALQLKQAVVGYGRAHKAQVQAMIMRLLRLDHLPTTDAADALGVAICHAHSHGAS